MGKKYAAIKTDWDEALLVPLDALAVLLEDSHFVRMRDGLSMSTRKIELLIVEEEELTAARVAAKLANSA